MIYAVISDVHANASALRKVLADAWKEGATRIVCLGDVVGYGPEPAQAVTALRVEKAAVVAGNHDDAVSGRAASDGFNALAADAVSRHRAALRDDEREWLGALPYITNLEGGAVGVHGDLTAPMEFRYIETTDDAAANFAVCANTLIFVGHTHEPCLFITGKSGKTYKTKPQDFTVEQGKRYIVNVGTVGYPREENGVCRSSYVLYDSDRSEIRFRFLPFAVSSVMQRGRPPEAGARAEDAGRAGIDAESRRQGRIVAAAMCAIVAIFALTMLFVAGRGRRGGESPSLPTVKNVSPAKVEVGRVSGPVKEVYYIQGEKALYPNLWLAPKSDPAILTVTFLSQPGATIGEKAFPVKESKTMRMPVPPGTHRVEFTVVPEKKGGNLVIRRFTPSSRKLK